MSRYIELHPDNPQTRLVAKVVDALRDGGLVAYPTDSGYALACAPGNKEGLDRIRTIRQLDVKHNFTFICADFAQVGPLAIVGNNAFRLIKRLTPGPWTFILKGTKEVPRMTLNPKKHTLGVRIPDHAITQALVAQFGEPLLSSSSAPEAPSRRPMAGRSRTPWAICSTWSSRGRWARPAPPRWST